jgi:hypothetical protein
MEKDNNETNSGKEFYKILLVTKYFHPDIAPRSFRATELAIELARRKHDVTILTHRKQVPHLEMEKHYGFTIKDLKPLRFSFLSSGLSPGKNLLSKAINWIGSLLIDYPFIEYLFRVPKAISRDESYDLIISIANPHPIHWGVARAIKNNPSLTKAWIADCGDPYILVENALIQRPFYFRWVEQWWGKKADYITVPIAEARRAYDRTLRSKIKVIPHGFRIEAEHTAENASPENPVPTFCYGGGLIPKKMDPRKFIDFLLSLDQPYKFYLFTTKSHLIRSQAEQSKNRIIIKLPIPRKDFLDFMRQMDFLVNFECESKTQSPSKLIDYAILRKPVLSIPSRHAEEDKTLEFLNGNYRQAMPLKDISPYRIEHVTDQFLNLADQVIKNQ